MDAGCVEVEADLSGEVALQAALDFFGGVSFGACRATYSVRPSNTIRSEAFGNTRAWRVVSRVGTE